MAKYKCYWRDAEGVIHTKEDMMNIFKAKVKELMEDEDFFYEWLDDMFSTRHLWELSDESKCLTVTAFCQATIELAFSHVFRNSSLYKNFTVVEK